MTPEGTSEMYMSCEDIVSYTLPGPWNLRCKDEECGAGRCDVQAVGDYLMHDGLTAKRLAHQE